jgi:ATP phosphoribosyltransferase regulatory subunit
MTSADPDISAKSLARLREQHLLTQAAAAAEIGVSQATYSRWEKENNEPTGAARRALADWVIRRSGGTTPVLNAAFPVRLGISDPEKAEELAGQLSAAGYLRVDPPIVQPAAPFLDVSGEDLRRRMFLTSDAEGNELCLRPDLTIPTARLHLASGDGGAERSYFYLGPVFRQRESGGSEVQQAGIEIFGAANAEDAEAEVIARSADALRLYGISDAELKMGDRGLIAAFLEALNIPRAWRRRLMRDVARQAGLGRDLAALAPSPGTGSSHAAFLAALDGADPKAARAVVEDMLSLAGISQVGGRSPSDIAERFIEQASLRASASLPAATHDALTEFLTVEAPLDDALKELRAVITTAKNRGATGAATEVDAALASFETRSRKLSERIDTKGAVFSTSFGRQLDYYTGLVFEFRTPRIPMLGPLVGGGRYDGLLTALGAKDPVRAVGCALFIERMTEAAQ